MIPLHHINVMLVEDHPMVRKGLRALLKADGQFKMVGEAKTGSSMPRDASSASSAALSTRFCSLIGLTPSNRR